MGRPRVGLSAVCEVTLGLLLLLGAVVGIGIGLLILDNLI